MALVTNVVVVVVVPLAIVVLVAKFFWRLVATVSVRYHRWLRYIFYHTRVVNTRHRST